GTSTTTILPVFVGLLAFLVILFVLRAFRKK
ncbi:MAG: LPXTG cell wall anchor domain-containing protein, partial [Chloroflexi bacterium]|nr:LPXTG cell wall anchor domain-containing protein [Chloroflexota bacterium]